MAYAGTMNMDSGVTPGEVGGVFAGLISLLVAIGHGSKWLLNWKGAREKSTWARLKAHEKSLDEREIAQRQEIEKRFAALEKKYGAMENKVSMMAAVLFEAIAELQVLDAGSVALAKARIVLRKLFPAGEEVPADIEALVRRVGNGASLNGAGDE